MNWILNFAIFFLSMVSCFGSFGANIPLLDALKGSFKGAYANDSEMIANEPVCIQFSLQDGLLTYHLFRRDHRTAEFELALKDVGKYFEEAASLKFSDGSMEDMVAFQMDNKDHSISSLQENIKILWPFKFKYKDKELVAFRFQESSSDGWWDCAEIKNLSKIGMKKEDWEF